MFAVAGGGIQNFEILHKFLNSDKARILYVNVQMNLYDNTIKYLI